MQIDDEFKALIPPLSVDERAQLEANLLADGCRDPLVVWPLPTHTIDYSDAQDGSDLEVYRYSEAKIEFLDLMEEGNVSEYKTWGEDDEISEYDWPYVLIDGHNRLAICARLGVRFEVVKKEFEDRDDVIEWIIKNQFGRRNLSDYQRGVLALRLKPIIEARAKAKQANSTGGTNPQLRENSHEAASTMRTDEAVADIANISSNTIRKIEQLENNAAPEVKALAASGDVSINLVAQFDALPEADKQEALAAIAAHHKPAKEIMRGAVHNHRAKDEYEAT